MYEFLLNNRAQEGKEQKAQGGSVASVLCVLLKIK